MTSNRIPCAICESMILESTAQSNSGLCGQCARDPESARHTATLRQAITDLGDATPQNYEWHFERFVTAAAEECMEIYGENMRAFLLYGIAHVESPSVRVVLDYHVSMLSGDAWDESGWGDLGEGVAENQFEALYGLRNDIEEGFDVLSVAISVLHRLREQEVLPATTLISIVDEGTGHGELQAVAELFNSEEVLKNQYTWLDLSDEDYLNKMREYYRKYRC